MTLRKWFNDRFPKKGHIRVKGYYAEGMSDEDELELAVKRRAEALKDAPNRIKFWRVQLAKAESKVAFNRTTIWITKETRAGDIGMVSHCKKQLTYFLTITKEV